MKREESFRDYVLDQLSGLPDLCSRPMFGGFGLYQGSLFFGIVHKGRLYVKVTADSVQLYEAQGMKPFRPNAKQTLKSYYEMPPAVLEDAEALLTWVDRAIACARQPPLRRAAGVRPSS